MNTFIPVKTPGGVIWAEVDAGEDLDTVQLTSIKDRALASFEDVTNALKRNARFLLDAITEVGPHEVEVAFGVKLGAEGGTPFFGLAKATGEASYVITLRWKPQATIVSE